MSKTYKLALVATYATLKHVYTTGVEYTAAAVGAEVDARDDSGQLYFKEVSDDETGAVVVDTEGTLIDSGLEPVLGEAGGEGVEIVPLPNAGIVGAIEGAPIEEGAEDTLVAASGAESDPAAPVSDPVVESAPAAPAPRVLSVGKGAKAKAAAATAGDADAITV